MKLPSVPSGYCSVAAADDHSDRLDPLLLL